MMAFVQILKITFLLFTIAEGKQGNRVKLGNEDICEKMLDTAAPAGEPCCQAHGGQTEVIYQDKKNYSIQCRREQMQGEQGKTIYWYTYGRNDSELGIFFISGTSETNHKDTNQTGIFTCTAKKKKCSVTSEDFCNSNKTIIISSTNDITDEKKSDSDYYVESGNFTFDCHVNLTVSYALLWIAEYHDGSTKCLSSMEVDNYFFTFSENKLCCPIKGVSQRINQTLSHHYLDIYNITSSQYGKYLCIVFYHKKDNYVWKTINKTIIQVTNGGGKLTGDIPYIVSGIIGGLGAVGVILCLVIFCRKFKGKQKKINQSHSNITPTEYECTPYAVSSRQDLKSNTMNIHGQEPLPMMDGVYSEVELTPIATWSEAQYSEVGTKVHSQYLKVGIRPVVVPNQEFSKN
ncbi:uncharacterized protein [Pyxicephalus adspersus]|uniref:uncharacterized protein n=1 Tax=Pyxicephalus adspersus TaxID=30357 RepID=UPI003B5A1593